MHIDVPTTTQAAAHNLCRVSQWISHPWGHLFGAKATSSNNHANPSESLVATPTWLWASYAITQGRFLLAHCCHECTRIPTPCANSSLSTITNTDSQLLTRSTCVIQAIVLAANPASCSPQQRARKRVRLHIYSV